VVGPAVEGLAVVALILRVPAGLLGPQGHHRLGWRARVAVRGGATAASTVASWGRLGAFVCVLSHARLVEVALILRGGVVVAALLPPPGALQPVNWFEGWGG